MASNVINDSSWPSIHVHDIKTALQAGAEASLPAIGTIVHIGAKIGVVIDDAYLGADTYYHLTVDTAARVRLAGVSGTCTDGAIVYMGSGLAGAVTLTVSTNTPIGFALQPKVATGDDLYVQLVPGTAIAQAV
jgi:hypothetical protein